MEENKKLQSLKIIYVIVNIILFIIILIISTYALRYSGQYELYINEDNKDLVYSYIGGENFRKDAQVKKIIYREVWDSYEYIVHYEDGKEDIIFLEDISWKNNLIKEEGIYIPLKYLGTTFILVIILILNTIKIKKIAKQNENELICGNISVITIITISLAIFSNFIFGITSPILMIPVSIILIFGGAGIIGLISYFIERKIIIQKTFFSFLKIVLINYILLLIEYTIYIVTWAGISAFNFNVITFIILISGETILGYIIGRGIHIPIHNKKVTKV